ncbi:hypothetical protein [Desulfitibacter alkalitolerans]|uniref:hypothetical protein n=1 Tax=Desulfitibacter alkalitolerans TaxID=264641 RepID=UPI0012EBA169|nr:hypothetical protein [Desulfitibacter alkalitolerans]
MMNSDQSFSFLIRIWKDDENRSAGQIENILTKERLYFEGLENLQVTLESLLEEKRDREA